MSDWRLVGGCGHVTILAERHRVLLDRLQLANGRVAELVRDGSSMFHVRRLRLGLVGYVARLLISNVIISREGSTRMRRHHVVAPLLSLLLAGSPVDLVVVHLDHLRQYSYVSTMR